MAKNTDFFKEQREQSLVKSTIVSRYFDVWSKVIINTQKQFPKQAQKIAYIDLFAGPGRYEDGTVSTPVKILQNAVGDPDLKDRLVTIFNDKNSDNTQELENIIEEIENISELKFKPTVWNEEVGENIVKEFESIKLIPTFFFVDPWGYKGLSLRLVNSVVKDWGCDAVFFFNYNRIHMGINNSKVKIHMEALFGAKRCEEIKETIVNKKPYEKELLIVEALCSALKEYGTSYVLPFQFKDAKGKRTSHHLIFVSKNFKEYEIMKNVMAKESSKHEDGVASFAYNPADLLPEQTLLFKLSRPLDNLKKDLLEKFKGKTLTMHQIYESHNVDTPFIKTNYKEVLKELLKNEEILTDRMPKPNTFADTIKVTFK